MHLISPRFVSEDRLKGASLKSHGRGVASLLYELLCGLDVGSGSPPAPGAIIDAVGGLLSATLEDFISVSAPPGNVVQVRVERIIRYMRRHFADPRLRAEDVAEALGISRRYLYRLLSEEGRTFRGELLGIRMEACVRAFRDGQQAEKTIAEIAYSVGYADISLFNRHFRKLRGETPSAARRAASLSLAASEGRRRSLRTAP
jgi:AraC-like DNA-binding protein